MTEILTESFCERCGTRYTFETARPRGSRIGRAKVFTKGLRNYVLSDDSFSEAMADARGEEELAVTSLQLDAFHRTFNFCLDCRQYTCGNCWNTIDRRCLSCAPLPGTAPVEPEAELPEVAADRLAAVLAPLGPEAPVPTEQDLEIPAWPAVDLSSAIGRAVETVPEPEPVEPAALEVDAALLEPAIEATSTDEAEDVEVAFATTPVVEPVAPEPEAAPLELAAAEPEVAAEPEAAPVESAAEPEFAAEPEAVPVGSAVEAVAEPEPELAPLEVAAAEPEAAAEPGVAAQPEAAPLELAAASEAAPIEVAAAEPEAPEAGPLDAAGEPSIEPPGIAADTADAELAPATPLIGLAPGQSLEEAIAAYEASLQVEPTPAPEALDEPAVALPAAPLPEPAVADRETAAEPELPVDEVQPTIAATAEPEPPTELARVPAAMAPAEALAEPAAPTPEPALAPAPAADLVPFEAAQPGAQPPLASPSLAAPSEPVALPPVVETVAPEVAQPPIAATAEPAPAAAPPTPLPGWLAVAPDDGTPPAWPVQPAWHAKSRQPMAGTLAGRTLLPPGNAADLWSASAREVMLGGPVGQPTAGGDRAAAATAQPCIGCGLPLSAHARFCRRCGARQG